MKLNILKYPDPKLKRICHDVSEINDTIKTLIANMTETMYQADGIGLAAPQVGEDIRLVVIDVTGPEKREDLRVLINPKITPDPKSGFEECEEGCLSVPNYRSKVRRHAKIHVEALDADGKPLSFDADGLLAVCIQHEVDHLNGMLFIDHISYLKRTLFDKKLRKSCGE